jgi:hypothetical protein
MVSVAAIGYSSLICVMSGVYAESVQGRQSESAPLTPDTKTASKIFEAVFRNKTTTGLTQLL